MLQKEQKQEGAQSCLVGNPASPQPPPSNLSLSYWLHMLIKWIDVEQKCKRGVLSSIIRNRAIVDYLVCTRTDACFDAQI